MLRYDRINAEQTELLVKRNQILLLHKKYQSMKNIFNKTDLRNKITMYVI